MDGEEGDVPAGLVNENAPRGPQLQGCEGWFCWPGKRAIFDDGFWFVAFVSAGDKDVWGSAPDAVPHLSWFSLRGATKTREIGPGAAAPHRRRAATLLCALLWQRRLRRLALGQEAFQEEAEGGRGVEEALLGGRSSLGHYTSVRARLFCLLNFEFE